jgi:hypothetical protein
MKRAVLLLPLLVACGEECDLVDVDGRYVIQFTELSGDCGALMGMRVRMAEGSVAPEDECTSEYEKWSDDACHYKRTSICDLSADGTREVLEWQGEQEVGGATLSGLVVRTVTELDTTNAICASTYRTRSVRQ